MRSRNWQEIKFAHAAHQFVEGDVALRHPVAGDMCTDQVFDDLLCPLCPGRIYWKTGVDILYVKVSFLKTHLKKEGEQERYGHTQGFQEEATVYEHCLRAWPVPWPVLWIAADGQATEYGMSPLGVGARESVWLGLFFVNINEICVFCPLQDEEREKIP